MLDEISREPVEKFRMGWLFAEDAEVAGRSHQALPEVPAPDAVDDDSGGERVVRSNDRSRQFYSAAADGVGSGIRARNDFHKPAGCNFSRLAKIAAQGHRHVGATGIG